MSQVPGPPPIQSYQRFDSPRSQKKGMSTLTKVLLIVGLAIGLPFVACIGTCTYLAVTAPPIDAMVGAQVPRDYVQQLEDLGILEAGETLEYFYTDGFRSIESGVYVLTNKRLVLYSRDWSTPKVSIPLADIAKVDVTYSTSMLEDSTIIVNLKDGSVYSFPVSNTKGGDKLYFQRLQTLVKSNGGDA